MSAWSAVAGAVTGLGGGIASAAMAARESKKARAFQKHMYQNRYQYQMSDMRKAGLNPILAYRQSPPGAPSGSTAKVPDLGQAMVRGMEAGGKASKVSGEKELIRQQTATSASQAMLADNAAMRESSQAVLNYDLMEKARADAQSALANANSANANAINTTANTDVTKARLQYEKIMSDFWKNNPWAAPAERGIRAVQGLGLGAAHSASQAANRRSQEGTARMQETGRNQRHNSQPRRKKK